MKMMKEHYYGEVKACELGYNPVGRPVMTTRFYVIDNVCIDTGQSHMREAAVNFFNKFDINMVLLTHHHEDHSGNAAAFYKRNKITVYGNFLTAEKMKSKFRIMPYQHLIWGKAEPLEVKKYPDVLRSKNISFVPIHTPGHSKDHTSLYVKEKGWLFSGDLYLASKIKFFRVDEKMKDSIESIRKILHLDFDELFCAHNPVLKNGKQAIAMKLEYLENFYGEVKQLLYHGYSEKEIIKNISRKEDHLVKMFTWGNASMANMVRSSILDIAIET